MKISITGSRSFEDYAIFSNFLVKAIKDLNIEITEIISGGAKGVDTLASRYAFQNHIPFTEILPDWEKYGKSAGMKRNPLILDGADYNFIFWDGESKGTQFNIKYCQDNKLRHQIFKIKKQIIDMTKIKKIVKGL